MQNPPEPRVGRVLVLPAASLLVATIAGLLAALPTAVAAAPAVTSAAAPARPASERPAVIPAPVYLRAVQGQSYVLNRATRVLVDPGSASATVGRRAVAVGQALADLLRPSTGFPVPVTEQGDRTAVNSIRLALDGSAGMGAEAYRLAVTRAGVLLRASTPTGLFRGVQTVRQLLPARVESRRAHPGPWALPGVQVEDHPRFGWRATMLDVARHFFSVREVRRYIDLLALYKVNVLHLHLTDDQGWRIEIDGWPRLTRHGGSTEVGGGRGGYYTQAEYGQIVRYARRNHITVVPEIDMPGHTNAALASYPELSCDGRGRQLYTGMSVGFSSLCVRKRVTYRFVNDVVREVAAMTPGRWIHIGGDEAHSTRTGDYRRFVGRVEGIVRRHGKQMLGWEEITDAHASPSSAAQHWRRESGARAAAGRGMQVVMAPASKTYLDMKYHRGTGLGLDWAGYTSVRDAYSWDPGRWARGVPAGSVLGPEAPLWSETLETSEDVEFMAFPRLPGLAERGWSPERGRSWTEYRSRLAAHGLRWNVLGVNYYRSPAVPWR